VALAGARARSRAHATARPLSATPGALGTGAVPPQGLKVKGSRAAGPLAPGAAPACGRPAPGSSLGLAAAAACAPDYASPLAQPCTLLHGA
jgi:hypothetical protein